MAEYNDTALHYAAWYGKDAVATQLLQANASVRAVTSVNGSTPLHLAAYQGHAVVVDLLLQANADPTAADKYGYTPARYAEQGGHKDLAARLRKAEQAAAAK